MKKERVLTLGFAAATLRANGFAIGFRPAHLAERVIRHFLASLVDSAEAQGASGG